jgi:hypothetical protein
MQSAPLKLRERINDTASPPGLSIRRVSGIAERCDFVRQIYGLTATCLSVLHGKGPGDRECIPIVVRFGSDAA